MDPEAHTAHSFLVANFSPPAHYELTLALQLSYGDRNRLMARV